MMEPGEVSWNHCTIGHWYYQVFVRVRSSDDLILTEQNKLMVFQIQNQGLRKKNILIEVRRREQVGNLGYLMTNKATM